MKLKHIFNKKIISGVLSALSIFPMGTTLVSAEGNQWDATYHLGVRKINIYPMSNYFTIVNLAYRNVFVKVESLYSIYTDVMCGCPEFRNFTPEKQSEFIGYIRGDAVQLYEELRHLKIDYTKKTVDIIDRAQFIISKIKKIILQISQDPQFSGKVDGAYIARLNSFLSNLFSKNIFFEISPCVLFQLIQPVTSDVYYKLGTTLHEYIDDSISFNNPELTDYFRELGAYILASARLEDHNKLVRKVETVMRMPIVNLKSYK